jgi:8-oxo-dGTP diphosphatase
MNDIVLRVAAKALIVNDEGEVLILREASTYEEGTNVGRYDVPGGRIDVAEAFFDGLKREVNEEVGLTVEPLYPLYVGEWRPVIKGVPTQIIAMFILCKATSAEVRLSDEHDQALWIAPADYAKYEIMPPDDRAIQAYISRNNSFSR